MIFPRYESITYDEKDKYILKKMEEFYRNSLTINQSFWSEANIDTLFESGDQHVWRQVYNNVTLAQRQNFNFNRIRRVINMVSGEQRKNRKSIIATPVDNADNKTADQITKTLFWVNNQENVLNTISDSFHGALVTGMNLLQVWIDYRSDPVSGNIKVDNCSYNSFMIDPYFKKTDLSDCNGLWKRSFLSRRECISLLPSKADEILKISTASAGNRDGKFNFMPESSGLDTERLLAYDEFYYRDYRTQRLLVDSQTGETQEWNSDDEERLAFFLKSYPTITVVDQEVQTVKLAIVIQGKVMYDGPNPLGIDEYPFVPVFGYFNPQLSEMSQRIQGIVRGLRDPQYLYNRRRNIELKILESQITSGWVYKEDALINPKDVFLAGEGRGIALKDTAQMTDVQPIQAPQIPPSMIQLSELLAKDIENISGINEELLGSATDDKAGILSMLRQGAGLTTLQGLFDQLDLSQKRLGKIIIKIIQTNFTPGKIKRIIEDEPTQQFHDKSFGRYDAAVEDGLNTATQKQMQFAQMLHLKEAGVPITTKDLLEASTLQNKDEIIKNAIENEKQQAEKDQMMQQITMQEQAAQIDLYKARAKADIGLFAERTSRVEENKMLAVERLHESNRDDAAATLDRVKAMKELEDMDINQLQSLLAMVDSFKNKESQDSLVEGVQI